MRFGMGLLNIQGQVQGIVIGLLADPIHPAAKCRPWDFRRWQKNQPADPVGGPFVCDRHLGCSSSSSSGPARRFWPV